ncbi:MAG: hypothetical protein ABIJ91_02035 [Candidatus Kuenenbacteria bacterium]
MWEQFKNLIIFVDENFLGIIFCIFIFYVLFYILFRLSLNHKIIKEYKRENNDNDKKFTTKRCIEDGDKSRRHYVYLIDENNKTYQWIEDDYTIKKLGYGYATREYNGCFSNKNYTIKERIKIYNFYNIFNIIGILKILKFKDN